MTRQLVGQVDSLVSSPLRHHNDATDLLHLRVVWWTGAIQVSSNLDEKDQVKMLITKLMEGCQPEIKQSTHTCARRSEMQMNFLRTFLGRMYV